MMTIGVGRRRLLEADRAARMAVGLSKALDSELRVPRAGDILADL
jgi:hypothetical protein